MAKTTTLVLAVSCSLFGFLACRGGGSTVLDDARYCQLDYHCPAGSYCSAGVCDSDCTRDSDCPSGQGCDPRGRCVAGGLTAPPPRFAGHLTANVTRLELSPGSPAGNFTLENDGEQAIERYHVIADDPGVEVSPGKGTLPAGASAVIGVNVRSLRGHEATLHVLSTGGRLDVAIAYYSTLAGRLEGTVTVQSPFWLGAAPFAIELAEAGGAAGGGVALAGAVDGEASLLWPVNAAANATDDGTDFSVSFQMVGMPGDPVDPLFDVPVSRTVVLEGRRDPGSVLSVSGTYAETVEWLPNVTFQVTGTFQLRRQGDATGKVLPHQPPRFTPKTPAPVAACTVASDPCDGDVDCLFGEAFAFEQLAGVTGFDDGRCLLPNGNQGACVAQQDIPCAFSAFAGDDDGQLDVLRAVATYGLLSGNDSISRALMPVSTAGGIGIDREIELLDDATRTAARGLHGGTGMPLALLQSGVAAAARDFGAAFQQVSGRDDPQNPGLGDVQRFGGAVAVRLFAGEEEIDRKARLGDNDVAVSAQNLANGVLLDLGALGALLSPGADGGAGESDGGADGGVLAGPGVDGVAAETIPGLSTAFSALAANFGNAIAGRDALGYSASYVPFAFDPAQPKEDLYHEAIAGAEEGQGTVADPSAPFPAARAAEAALQVASAAAAGNTSSLEGDLEEADSQLDQGLCDLCGAACSGLSSTLACSGEGQLGEDVDALRAAKAALAAQADRVANDEQKLELIQQQARQLYAVQDEELQAVRADGQVQVTVATDREREHAMNDTLACAGAGLSMVQANLDGAAGGLESVATDGVKGGGGGGTGFFGMAGSFLTACGPMLTAKLTHADTDPALAAASEARKEYTLLYGQVVVQDQAIQTAWFDALADSEVATATAVQQAALYDAAAQQVQNDWGRLLDAVDTARRNRAVIADHVANDLAFRLYQDADTVAWARAMHAARAAAFAIVRAYEYVTAQPLGSSGYGRQILAAETMSEIDAVLGLVKAAYDRSATGPNASWAQQREDEISLAQDILGIHGDIVDPVTGRTLTKADQFQRLLALPGNRDAQGNVALPFSTSILPGNGVFATDVAVDVITGLQASIASSSIAGRTAYVTLVQSGRGRLRATDGTIQTYALGSKTALVPASINGDPTSDPTPLPVDTDLYFRPVDDAAWTLVLDKQDEPSDAAVDVSQLTDIDFWIQHQTLTIQR